MGEERGRILGKERNGAFHEYNESKLTSEKKTWRCIRKAMVKKRRVEEGRGDAVP